jgi:ATP-binding cassette subfamily F protein 3
MISAQNIFLKFGDRILFDEINFVIKDNDKVGLVGRNGAGKSTLLRVLAKEQTPDGGALDFPNGRSLGFLTQDIPLSNDVSVIEECLSAFSEMQEIQKNIEKLNQEMITRTDYESDSYAKLITKFTDLSERFNILGGENFRGETEKVLKGLGFKETEFDKKLNELSGGWRMRVELAKLLLQKPDYLLLDEPTNHLDIESILWFENFLKTYPGSIILISHDKRFLDNTTNRTIEVELGKVFDYKMAYSKYLEERAIRKEQQIASFKNQQKNIAHKERIINKFMAKANKTKMAQSMKKQLDKMERVEVDEEDASVMNLRFPPPSRCGEIVFEGKGIHKSYGENQVLRGVDIQIERGQRVAFVGQNGQGKTTLAKIIVDNLQAEKGDYKLGYNVEIGYYAQNQSDELQGDLTLLQVMENNSPPEQRTKLRSILGSFMFKADDVDKKVSVLSGGERARLAMAAMLLHPFNLLVLDEPTNHLDILSKDVLKKALMSYEGTLLVVSHDRDFLDELTDVTFEFKDRNIHQHLGGINEFLERHAVEDMRLLSKRSELDKQEKGTASVKKEVDHKVKKQAQRDLQNAEKKIEKLEREIATLESLMGEADFYERDNKDKKLAEYDSKKASLTKVMAVWEDVAQKLDQMG